MRLEIVIPDSTAPNIKKKLTSLAKRLSSEPELVIDLQVPIKSNDSDIQALFTPEIIAEIDEAIKDIENGKSFSFEQVQETLQQKKEEWIAANQTI